MLDIDTKQQLVNMVIYSSGKNTRNWIISNSENDEIDGQYIVLAQYNYISFMFLPFSFRYRWFTARLYTKTEHSPPKEVSYEVLKATFGKATPHVSIFRKYALLWVVSAGALLGLFQFF